VEQLSERLARRGVFIEQADAHFYGQPHLNGFRVGFAFLSAERLALGLRAVAEELATLSAQPSVPSARTGSEPLQIRN
jgi:DNA-binding transcriptional MocR family regulator